MAASDRVAVFEISAHLSRQYSRNRLLSMRKSVNITDDDYVQESTKLSSTETFSARSFSNFINIYTEGTNIDIALTMGTNPEITFKVDGFIHLSGEGSFRLINGDTNNTPEIRLLYS